MQSAHFDIDESSVNGLRLRRNSYVQGSLSYRDSRKKIVWTFWKPGLGGKEVPWQPQVWRATTTAMVTGTIITGKSQECPRKKKH